MKPADVVTNETICEGESFVWNGQTLTTSGTFTQTNDVCEADEILNLTVTPTQVGTTTNETICEGESFFWEGQTFTTSGTFTSSTGGTCAGVNTLNLTVTPAQVGTTTNETICEGESFFWEGQTFTTSGTFTSSTGGTCAGVNTLNLTVTPKAADVITTQTICEGESYTWPVNNQVYTSAQIDRVVGAGCTADQVLNLSVTPKAADIVTTQNLCPGESFTWTVNNITYDAPQSGIRVVSAGCAADQVLNILPSTDCGAPGISLVKRTNGVDIDVADVPVILVGNTPMPVTWTYEVTNTGTTTLFDVVVTDDREGQACVIPTLEAGATQTCTLVGTAVRGMYNNVATVTGSSADGQSVTATDASAYIGVFINVEKIADRTEVCPGEVVNYTLITRLLGGAPGIEIRNIRVDDSHLAAQLLSLIHISEPTRPY